MAAMYFNRNITANTANILIMIGIVVYSPINLSIKFCNIVILASKYA